MSTSIVRKSLALCDPDLEKHAKSKKQLKQLRARASKVSKGKRLNIAEAKQKLQVQKQVAEENLALLKAKKKACAIKLSDDITQKIIERAVTRKPIQAKPKEEADQKTVFTEEDFQKFEQEYYDE